MSGTIQQADRDGECRGDRERDDGGSPPSDAAVAHEHDGGQQRDEGADGTDQHDESEPGTDERDVVSAARNTLPAASTASARPKSSPVPPTKNSALGEVNAGSNTMMKASVSRGAARVSEPET